MEQLISPYMDGELTSVEAGAVSHHLSTCAHCQSDYAMMLRLSEACKQISRDIIPAPAGFKDALMQRINTEEKVFIPPQPNHRFNLNWKQSVAGAAAALLLVLGAASFNIGPMVQIAENPPSIVQPDQSSTPAISQLNGQVNNPTATSTGTTNSTSEQTQVNTMPTTSFPTVNSGLPNQLLLNKERTIVSTLLQVKVDDSDAALEQAISMAAKVQAQTQNLGQQINENGAYTALKITVAKSAASDLRTQLSSLGTVANQEVSKNDITTRYAETLSQYQILIIQRATLQDADQQADLNQRLASLENQLQGWEQKAEQETILLWIEK